MNYWVFFRVEMV